MCNQAWLRARLTTLRSIGLNGEGGSEAPLSSKNLLYKKPGLERHGVTDASFDHFMRSNQGLPQPAYEELVRYLWENNWCTDRFMKIGFAKEPQALFHALVVFLDLDTQRLTAMAQELPGVTAEATGDPDLLIMGHRTACTSYYYRGDFNRSREHGDRVLALYIHEQHRHLADITNTDPKTVAGIFVSAGTWMLGYPDRAVQVSEANEAHARRRGHPFDLGFALTTGARVWDLRCEPEPLLARVEEAERLGRAHSLPFISDVLAQLMKGLAWVRAGRLAEGIPHLRGAMEKWNANGALIWMPYFRAVLAEGLALSADLEGGLSLIEESLAQIARPGWEERWPLAEVLRLKGWMLQQQGQLAAAEENYLASLDVAREQQAKSWELRTSSSLARLWQSQGKRKEALELLKPVYDWFTEGFDTKDLKEAKALLEELA